MEIITGALVLYIIINYFCNRSIKSERDFYKAKTIDVLSKVRGNNFQNTHLVECELAREYIQGSK